MAKRQESGPQMENDTNPLTGLGNKACHPCQLVSDRGLPAAIVSCASAVCTIGQARL